MATPTITNNGNFLFSALWRHPVFNINKFYHPNYAVMISGFISPPNAKMRKAVLSSWKISEVYATSSSTAATGV